MKEAESVAPALGDERPEENGAAGENDSCGPLGEDGEPQEETEENKGRAKVFEGGSACFRFE